MAKTVGTLAYKIVTDLKDFNLGPTKNEIRAAAKIMEESTSDADKFAKSLQGIKHLADKGLLGKNREGEAGAIRKLKEEFGMLDKSFSKTFMGMVPVIDPVSLALRGVSSAAHLVGDAVGLVTTKVGESYERIQELGNAAESLGVSAEQFQILEFAAGQADIEMGTLEKGMFSMEKAVASAAEGNKKLSKVFDDLGIDAAQLKQMDPAEQFRAIIKELREVPNATDRVADAAKIFGKSALEMMRLINSGAEGLDDSEEKLKEMNGIVTGEGINAVNELDGAWKEMKRSVESIFMKLSVDLAPALTVIAEDFTDFLADPGTKSEIQRITDAIVEMANAIADATDNIKGMVSIANGIGEVADDLLSLEAFGFRDLSKIRKPGVVRQTIKDIDNLVGHVDAFDADALADAARGDNDRASRKNREMRERARDIEAEAQEMRSAFRDAEGSSEDDGLSKQAKKDADAIDDLIAKLKEQNNELMFGAEQVKRWKLEEQGATEVQIEAIVALEEIIKAEKELANLKDEAAKAIASTKTPMQKAEEDAKKYGRMIQDDLINEEQFNALIGKSASGAAGKSSSSAFSNPAIMEGSQEAIAKIAEAQFGIKAEDKLEDIKEELKKIAKNTKQAPVEVEVISRLGG